MTGSLSDKPSSPRPPVLSRTLSQGGLPSITSAELLADSREILILHEAETYRLRVTANNKLILSK